MSAAAGALLTALVSGVLISRANADDIGMLVVIGTDKPSESRMNIEVRDGQQAEIKLERELRLLVTPRAKNGQVLVAAEIYGWDGQAFQLVGTPRLLMESGRETRLQMNLGNGHVARISITPR